MLAGDRSCARLEHRRDQLLPGGGERAGARGDPRHLIDRARAHQRDRGLRQQRRRPSGIGRRDPLRLGLQQRVRLGRATGLRGRRPDQQLGVGAATGVGRRRQRRGERERTLRVTVGEREMPGGEAARASAIEVGRQRRRPLERLQAGAGSAARDGVERGLLQRRRQLLVGLLGGDREVPRARRRGQHRGERAMRGAALAGARGVVDGRAHLRVAEAHVAVPDRDEAVILGRAEDAEPAERPRQRRSGSVAAGGGEQERLARLRRQPRQAGGVGAGQPPPRRRQVGQRRTARALRRRQLDGTLQQRQRVAADRLDERLRDRRREPATPRDRHRRGPFELLHDQRRQLRPAVERLAPQRMDDHHRRPDPVGATSEEGDRLARGGVEPLHVVDGDRDRRVRGNEGGDGVQDGAAVRAGRALERQRGAQRAALGAGSASSSPSTGSSSARRPANGSAISLSTPVTARSGSAVAVAAASRALLPTPGRPATTTVPPSPATSARRRSSSTSRPISSTGVNASRPATSLPNHR